LSPVVAEPFGGRLADPARFSVVAGLNDNQGWQPSTYISPSPQAPMEDSLRSSQHSDLETIMMIVHCKIRRSLILLECSIDNMTSATTKSDDFMSPRTVPQSPPAPHPRRHNTHTSTRERLTKRVFARRCSSIFCDSPCQPQHRVMLQVR
jgi:hypothetical protein